VNTEGRQALSSAFEGRYLLLASIGIFPFLVNGPINARIAPQPLWYWSFELLIWVAVPLWVLLTALRMPGCRLADLGFHAALPRCRGLPAVAAASLLFAPLCYFFYDAVYRAFGAWFQEGGYFEYESMIPEAGLPHYAAIAYFALSAGLVEEFLFRGLLFRAALEFHRPAIFFLLVSPLLFSLVHWESGIGNLFATWVYGLFAAGVYLGLRNLWPLVAGHVLTDLLWFA
jgi:membrane protease YdiL (CAAX protease family)